MKNKVYERMLQPRVKRLDCFNILTGTTDQPRNDSYHEKKKAKLHESPYRFTDESNVKYLQP